MWCVNWDEKSIFALKWNRRNFDWSFIVPRYEDRKSNKEQLVIWNLKRSKNIEMDNIQMNFVRIEFNKTNNNDTWLSENLNERFYRYLHKHSDYSEKREKKREKFTIFPRLINSFSLIQCIQYIYGICIQRETNNQERIAKSFFVYVAYVIKARNELLRDFCKRVIIVGLHNSTSGASNETNQ